MVLGLEILALVCVGGVVSGEVSLREFIKAWKELEVENARRGFITHLVVYIIVNSFLIFANLWISPEVMWFV